MKKLFLSVLVFLSTELKASSEIHGFLCEPKDCDKCQEKADQGQRILLMIKASGIKDPLNPFEYIFNISNEKKFKWITISFAHVIEDSVTKEIKAINPKIPLEYSFISLATFKTNGKMRSVAPGVKTRGSIEKEVVNGEEKIKEISYEVFRNDILSEKSLYQFLKTENGENELKISIDNKMPESSEELAETPKTLSCRYI